MKYLLLVVAIGVLAYLFTSYRTGPIYTVPEGYRGVWDRTAYGDTISITDRSATVFQYTRQSCIKAHTFKGARLSELISDSELSDDGQTIISMEEGRPLLTSQLTRIDALPERCAHEQLTKNTPTANFDHLWHTFNDYYAFFEEREIDWDSKYSELRPTIDDTSSDDDLLNAFRLLLTPLNDGHVNLETNDDVVNYAEQTALEMYIIDAYSKQTEFDNLDDYKNSLNERIEKTIFSYFDSGMLGNAGGSDGTSVQWAVAKNNVGYLYISSMYRLASEESNSADDNVDAINSILKSALTNLNDTDALIIDIRFNGGGFDEVSLAIANHFIDRPALAFSKFTRSHQTETDPIEAFFNPVTDSVYLNPIVILSSENTASAAEVFLTMMVGLNHVTIVGENTYGGLADQLYKVLPNNWSVAVPNVVFMDPQGVSYEVTGVPPDIPASTVLKDILEREKDLAIEAAFTALGYQ